MSAEAEKRHPSMRQLLERIQLSRSKPWSTSGHRWGYIEGMERPIKDVLERSNDQDTLRVNPALDRPGSDRLIAEIEAGTPKVACSVTIGKKP